MIPDRLAAALADRYRLERELGQGGMATVYLAQDLRHDRPVAIKVLKPDLAAVLGAERFVTEIKTTAALQHPHILPLFDSGTADGFLFYVMPYVEGETLRTKLDRERQLGIEESVRIAGEVADALDYAHRHGVIHRDIKPENILLHDGRPIVADFGIALAVSAAAGGRMTETGLSLGTPHYMSPEQATAEKEITARSDVYSLASVLYEMLAGQPPHLGGSAQQIIMKIITETPPPVTQYRRSVPPHVAATLAKALEKLPADRFASAAEFGAALGNASFRAAGLAGTGRPGGPTLAASRAVRPLAAAAIMLAVFAAWGWLRSTPAPSVIRYQLAMPPSQAWQPMFPPPVPSPDGALLVYHGPLDAGAPGVQLWAKRRDSHLATPIPGTVNAQRFAISPDGGWIALTIGSQLRKLPLAGGAQVTLVTDGVIFDQGVTWLDDGTIVYVRQEGGEQALIRITEDGGEPVPLWRSTQGSIVDPQSLPDGHGVLFSLCTGAERCALWSVDLRGDDPRALLPDVTPGVRFAPTGHLVYVNDGQLLAIEFDARRREVRGRQIPLADSAAGSQSFQLSRSGTLVTRSGGNLSATYQMVWVDRTGRETPVDSLWRFRLTAAYSNHGWALSPDGGRLAIGLSTDAGDDVWVKLLPRGPVSRLTFDPRVESRPRWTSDGSAIVFLADGAAAGAYRRRADATGADTLLVAGPLFNEALPSPDGEWLLLRQGAVGPSAGGRDITGVRLGRDTTPVPVIATRFDETAIALSPDGRWLAYQSDETGRTEVFVRSFPRTDSFKRQVSNGGGGAPLWSRDGREMFYLSAGKEMMAVRVGAGGAPDFGDPAALFRVPDELLAVETFYYTPWDIARDGRFIMARVQRDADEGVPVAIIAENWLTELRRKGGRR